MHVCVCVSEGVCVSFTWTMKVLSWKPGVRPTMLMYDASWMKFSMPWNTPRPVAEMRPWMPPWLMGLPVTQAWALMSCEGGGREREGERQRERERDRETETHLEGSTISLVHYGAGVHGAIPSMT